MRYFFDTEFIEDGKTIDLISIGVVAEDGREFYAVNRECQFERASEWVAQHVLGHLAAAHRGRQMVRPPAPMPKRAFHTREYRVTEPGLMGIETRTDFYDHAEWVTRAEISRLLRIFASHDDPEFWAYYGAYDWVALCQLFGTMMDLPKGWPRYVRDLKQLADQRRITICDGAGPPARDLKDCHHALLDARWVRDAWLYVNGGRTT